MKKQRPVRTVPILLALAAGLASALTAPVRAAAADHLPRGGAGYFMIGGSFLDLGGLNAALERGGYSAFSGSFLTVGGGGHALIGRLILGGEGQSIMEKSGSRGDTKTVVSGGCGFFDIGYVVHSGRGLLVYPLFGVGAGSIDLKISGRETALFEEVLVDPGRSARLQTSGFLMQVALGADRWMGPAGRDRRRGFFIAVRAGYVFAPVKGAWEIEGTEIGGGPGVGWTGPYLRISIGAGRGQ